MKKEITLRQKINSLINYLKLYSIKDPVAVGVVLKLSGEDILQKGAFVQEATSDNERPLLVMTCRAAGAVRLTFKGQEYNDLFRIFQVLYSVEKFDILIVFPEGKIPEWYSMLCEPNEFSATVARLEEEINSSYEHGFLEAEYRYVLKEALLALIDNALERKDKNRFLALSKEWKQMAG